MSLRLFSYARTQLHSIYNKICSRLNVLYSTLSRHISESLWCALWNCSALHFEFWVENSDNELCWNTPSILHIVAALLTDIWSQKTKRRPMYFEFLVENSANELCSFCADVCLRLRILHYVLSIGMVPQILRVEPPF